jgi:putative solute:sodium symporter small subunit
VLRIYLSKLLLYNYLMNKYWQENLRIIFALLSIWFLVSFGFGIIFSEWLDQFKIGGFKLGFWFAQQGSIFFFVILIFIYVHLMNKLDEKYKDKEK